MICKTGSSVESSGLVSVEIVDASKTTASFEIRGKKDFGSVGFKYKVII